MMALSSTFLSILVSLLAPAPSFAAEGRYSVCSQLFVAGSAEKVAKAQAEFKLASQERLDAMSAMGGRMMVQIATADYVSAARELLMARGYRCREMEIDDTGYRMSFVVEDGPPGSRSAAVLQNLRGKSVTMVIGLKGSGGAYGTYVRNEKTIMLSPDHAMVGGEILTSTFLHEIRHMKHDFDIAAGKASPYDAEVRSVEGNEVTRVKGYNSYFSFQELSTHGKDSHLLRAGAPGLRSIVFEEPITLARHEKEANVREMAAEIADVTGLVLGQVKSAENLPAETRIFEDPELGATICVEIPFLSPVNGKRALLRVWLPELKTTPLAKIPGDALRSALLMKLQWIGNNARSFN